MFIIVAATLARADPVAPDPAPVAAEPRERVLVLGAPLPGAEPGWVAGLGDCLQERLPGRYQVLDRRDAATTWASLPTVFDDIGTHTASRIVVALPPEEAPKVDVAALQRALASLEVPPRRVWLLPALPIRPDRRGSAYQELSGLAAKKLTLSVLDPWKNLGETEVETASSTWLSEGMVTAAGQVRVASVACNAVLPRTP